MKDNVTEQKWFCEVCDKEGSIPLKPHEDVMSVIYKIEDSHEAMSPDCPNPIRNIRVVNHWFVK